MMPQPQAMVAEGRATPFASDERARRMAEVYAPVFNLILQLRAAEEFGDPDVLRRRIKDLLDQAEREARRAGAGTEAVGSAKFALVAFIDETILSSNWSYKGHWVAQPLQLEFYNRYDAGEAFFERLEQMRHHSSSNAEVLEIYYLCMALGFKGRYQLHEQERLRILIEETYAVLRQMPGFDANEIAPHAKPRDHIATEVQTKVPAWVIGVAALAVAVIVYLSLSLLVSGAADDAAREIDQLITVEPTR